MGGCIWVTFRVDFCCLKGQKWFVCNRKDDSNSNSPKLKKQDKRYADKTQKRLISSFLCDKSVVWSVIRE